MPIANIAPNIRSRTQRGDFRFTIIFDISSTQTLDRSSFTLSNVSIDDSSNVSLRLINVSRNTAYIYANVSGGTSGNIIISVTGTITVDSVSETLTGTSQTISYDTTTGITNVIINDSDIEYQEDGTITVPILFGSTNDDDDFDPMEVFSLSHTDFSFTKTSGDDIDCMETWLTGSGASYSIHMLPEIDTSGTFLLDIDGSILTDEDDPGSIKSISINPLTIPYDRRIPVPNANSPEPLASGEWHLYMNMNVAVKELQSSSFEVDGVENATITHIYRFIDLTSRPSDTEYTDLTNTALWVSEDISSPMTTKGRYFVIAFNIPEVNGDTINVSLKRDAVINAVYPEDP